jgi:hypothetical protein
MLTYAHVCSRMLTYADVTPPKVLAAAGTAGNPSSAESATSPAATATATGVALATATAARGDQGPGLGALVEVSSTMADSRAAQQTADYQKGHCNCLPLNTHINTYTQKHSLSENVPLV